jgi:hypothetical protein
MPRPAGLQIATDAGYGRERMARAEPVADEPAVRCFDPRLAEHPTATVRVGEVIDLLEVSHAPERIEEYRRAMLAGGRFPPVSVIRLAGRLFIADGHKRFQAFRALGADEITVELWSKRRWLGDQWRQLARKTRSQGSLLLRLPHDAEARAGARRLFWDTVGHWRRLVASLRALAGRGELPPRG